MHPLPAGAEAAAGSFFGMLRKHGPKRKTDRYSSGAAAIISNAQRWGPAAPGAGVVQRVGGASFGGNVFPAGVRGAIAPGTSCYPDRKSTRLNSSHLGISY